MCVHECVCLFVSVQEGRRSGAYPEFCFGRVSAVLIWLVSHVLLKLPLPLHPRDILVTVVCFFLSQSSCFPSQTVIFFPFLWLSDSVLLYCVHFIAYSATDAAVALLQRFFWWIFCQMGIILFENVLCAWGLLTTRDRNSKSVAIFAVELLIVQCAVLSWILKGKL